MHYTPKELSLSISEFMLVEKKAVLVHNNRPLKEQGYDLVAIWSAILVLIWKGINEKNHNNWCR